MGVIAKAFREGQSAAKERLGLGQPVAGDQQRAQTVEGPCLFIVGPGALGQGQRATQERLGLGQPVGVVEYPAQIDEIREDVLLVERLIVRKRPAKQGLGFERSVGIPEQSTQLIEGAMQCRPADHTLRLGREPLLGRGKLPTHQRFGLGVPRLPVIHLDQVGEGRACICVVGTTGLLLGKNKDAFVKRFGLEVTALALV